jgi:hypothetical protein
VELKASDTDQLLNVELTEARFAELGLKSGDTVCVSARRTRVFVSNYSI